MRVYFTVVDIVGMKSTVLRVNVVMILWMSKQSKSQIRVLNPPSHGCKEAIQMPMPDQVHFIKISRQTMRIRK